jgi:hypothetical protein
MRKNIFLLVVLALALSTTAFADNDVTFTNDGGNQVSDSWGFENGVLFYGVFSRLQTWTFEGGGYHTYTAPIDVNNRFPVFSSRWPRHSPGAGPGTFCQAVPEPGELSLIGTGLLGLIGAIRRKTKR